MSRRSIAVSAVSALLMTVLFAGCWLNFSSRLTSYVAGLSGYRGRVDTGGGAESVALYGDRAYVFDRVAAEAADSGSLIQIVDVSDPVSASIVDEFDGSPGYYPSLVTFTQTDATTWLMLISIASDSVYVFDLTDPDAPALATSFDAFSGAGMVSDVRIAGDLAYFVGDGFTIWDFGDSNPVNWVELGTIPGGDFSGTPEFRQLCLAGDYAYVANEDFGLVIINIANTASPSITRVDTTINTVSDVDVLTESDLVVTDDYYNSWSVNIVNPTTPIPSEPEEGVMGHFSVRSPQTADNTDASEMYARRLCYRFDAVELLGIDGELVPLRRLIYPGLEENTGSQMMELVTSYEFADGLVAVAHGSDGLVLFDMNEADY